jgi:MFS family permease
LVTVKLWEIAIMAFALTAFFFGQIQLMLGGVFLMGLHSAFFSPAKYGILPEMLPERDLSRGNGLLEMSTFMAIILGTSVGSAIFSVWKYNLPLIGLVMIAIAVLGYLTSLGISRVPPSGAAKLLRLNPFSEIADGLRRLAFRASALAHRDRHLLFLVSRRAGPDQHTFLRQRTAPTGRVSHRLARHLPRHRHRHRQSRRRPAVRAIISNWAWCRSDQLPWVYV